MPTPLCRLAGNENRLPVPCLTVTKRLPGQYSACADSWGVRSVIESPVRPPSPAAIVRRLTFFSASRRLNAFCDWIGSFLTTLTDCGISRRGIVILMPVEALSAL